GEVTGEDRCGHAKRARRRSRVGVLELVCRARVVEEVRSGERDIDVPRLADRLSAVEGLSNGELPRPLLDETRETEEVLRPLGRCKRRPAVLERTTRRVD